MLNAEQHRILRVRVRTSALTPAINILGGTYFSQQGLMVIIPISVLVDLEVVSMQFPGNAMLEREYQWPKRIYECPSPW
jgi:hypothetical protein